VVPEDDARGRDLQRTVALEDHRVAQNEVVIRPAADPIGAAGFEDEAFALVRSLGNSDLKERFGHE
jgi:hypothetical protein